MAVAKTEIVCDVREQVKLAASAHLGLERDLNCIETVHNINSEDHKGVSGKDRWPVATEATEESNKGL